MTRYILSTDELCQNETPPHFARLKANQIK